MDINRYVLAYFLFSMLGWVWESIYCTLKSRRWANRGFCYGPVCPIYGWGSLLGVGVVDLVAAGVLPQLGWWMILAIGFGASMVLEYPTSVILEKLFHARWWDYSRVPLNIHGRTSVPTSIGFGVGAIVIVEWVAPGVNEMIHAIPQVLVVTLPLVLVAVHSADLTLTVSHLTDFQKHVVELDAVFQERMTTAVDTMYGRRAQRYASTVNRIVSFRMSESRNQIAHQIRERIRAH